MKIITWNCQGAFRKKVDLILAHNPDILVIQECEHPDKLMFGSSTKKATDFLWFGDYIHKGVGIFSYGGYKLKLIEQYNADFKTIVPISVTNGNLDFTLFAICANNPKDKANQYIGQVWKAINYYDLLLNKGKTILTGDFNSNKIWDKPKREGNHSAVVEKLALKNIHSIYHKHLDQEQGNEKDPTFFLQRNPNKPYHIDYCFASEDFINNLDHFEIGGYEKWIPHSDHLPLMIKFDL